MRFHAVEGLSEQCLPSMVRQEPADGKNGGLGNFNRFASCKGWFLKIFYAYASLVRIQTRQHAVMIFKHFDYTDHLLSICLGDGSRATPPAHVHVAPSS